jgi:hypothetical protein
MLTVTTQQQWALLECIRTERERREAQMHPDRARPACGHNTHAALPS